MYQNEGLLLISWGNFEILKVLLFVCIFALTNFRVLWLHEIKKKIKPSKSSVEILFLYYYFFMIPISIFSREVRTF